MPESGAGGAIRRALVAVARSWHHRVPLLVMLGTHGLCTSVASWWSYRTRSLDRLTKAKASEAGRVLAGGWLALVLLGIASTTEHDVSIAPGTTFVTVLVITAIGVVIGTGYTRYVEAVVVTGSR